MMKNKFTKIEGKNILVLCRSYGDNPPVYVRASLDVIPSRKKAEAHLIAAADKIARARGWIDPKEGA